MILASSDTATWVGNVIGIPAGVAGIGIPLYLWLSGKIKLNSDADRELETAKSVAADREDELGKQIIALTADRDAWKVAHAAEVEARSAASRAATALLDSAQLSAQLLEVIREQLAIRSVAAKTHEEGKGVRHE